MKTIHKLIAALFAVALGLSAFTLTTGCNTIRGAGEDISEGGEAISDGAQKTKEAITGEDTD